MKLCDEKRTPGVSKNGLCEVLCDLLFCLERTSQWIMCAFGIAISSAVAFCISLSNDQMDTIINGYQSTFVSLLGFTVAAFAIIVGFQSETLTKLLSSVNGESDKTKPFHVICASKIFNGLTQVLIIVFTFVYSFCDSLVVFYFTTFLAGYAITQVADILLQLFSFRTFVANK